MFNTTVAWITLRATLSRRRALLFALPAVVLILLTAALKATRPPMLPWPSHVLGTFGFSVLIPLAALISGSGSIPGQGGQGAAGLATIGTGTFAVALFVGALACSVIYNAVFV